MHFFKNYKQSTGKFNKYLAYFFMQIEKIGLWHKFNI